VGFKLSNYVFSDPTQRYHCRHPFLQEAFNSGDREKLLYLPAVVPDHSRPDYLVTVDADPESKTFSQVIHRLPLGTADELHHSGWNACSSCFEDSSKSRSLLILPALGSGRVHAIDVATDPRAPRLAKTVEKDTIVAATGLSYLHSTHCLATGEIMISAMGDSDGEAKGGFLVLDEKLNTVKLWSDQPTLPYGYDYWYQPRINAMVSTGWGAPKAFSKGFNPAEVETFYNRHLYFWDWSKKKVIQEIDLGPEGLIPLEVRFLHEPTAPHGFVGAALSSNIIHFTPDNVGNGSNGTPSTDWVAKTVIKQPWLDVEGWILPQLPPLITDILISLDDKYIYFSNWLRGDLVQYDISDPAQPKLAGRIWLGGVARRGDDNIKVTGGLPEDVGTELPEVPTVKGTILQGGPQMLQLSLGKFIERKFY
jgi:methanethiol oxidase